MKLIKDAKAAKRGDSDLPEDLGMEMDEVAKDLPESEETEKKKRFILFIGNLPFGITKEKVVWFLRNIADNPTVRLLTKKDSNEPKGCGFVEFVTAKEMQKAVLMDGVLLEGRKVRLQATAAGGGKSENRIKKIEAKQKKLTAFRSKVHKKWQAIPVEERKQKRKDREEANWAAWKSGTTTTSAKDKDPEGAPKKKKRSKQDDEPQVDAVVLTPEQLKAMGITV